MLGIGLGAERVDVRVLEQQEVVVGRRARAVRAGACRPRRTGRARANGPAASSQSSSAAQSRVSIVSLSRLRNAAAYAPSNARWSPRIGEDAHAPDGDDVGTVGTGDDDRALVHAVGREDGDLGLVDDRQRHVRAVGTRVRDRERAAEHLVGEELLVAGPGGEVADLAGDGAEPLAVGVADDRRDQTLEVEVDRDGQMDVVVDDETVAVDRRVHVRELVDRVTEGTGHEREVGEREALARPPFRLVRFAHAGDALEVDLDRRVHVRARRLGADHVLGRAPPDVRERDDLVARGGRDPHRRRGDRRRRRDDRGLGRRRWAAEAAARPRGPAPRRREPELPERPLRPGCGGGTGGCRDRARRRGRAARGSGWRRVAATVSTTSLRVMRPPSPVPRTELGSRPYSVIRRRTTGDVSRPPPSARGGLVGRRRGREPRARPGPARSPAPGRP